MNWIQKKIIVSSFHSGSVFALGDRKYEFDCMVSFVLGITFAFIDGMLLWAIGFFSLTIILVLMRIIWNNAVWADNVTRKLGDD